MNPDAREAALEGKQSEPKYDCLSTEWVVAKPSASEPVHANMLAKRYLLVGEATMCVDVARTIRASAGAEGRDGPEEMLVIEGSSEISAKILGDREASDVGRSSEEGCGCSGYDGGDGDGDGDGDSNSDVVIVDRTSGPVTQRYDAVIVLVSAEKSQELAESADAGSRVVRSWLSVLEEVCSATTRLLVVSSEQRASAPGASGAYGRCVRAGLLY